MCSVPMQISGGVLAAFLSEHGDVEDVVRARSSSGTTYGDCFFAVWGGVFGLYHVRWSVKTR